MQENQKIKFAVVGAGHIGKRHAEMISREEEAELVAMVDLRTKEECEAERFDVPFFKSLEELVESGIEFDVANICTPNGLHASQSLVALQEKKHVVCEKPMGLSKDNCEKVIFKSLQMSKNVFCVMQNRYSPPSEWIKSVIDNKVLGDTFMVQLNCYWNRDSRYYKAGGWK
ncbi:MAG: Gfo/Idh/MocA family protein, partial [Crocinitomicaceae bacterium]